MLCSAADTTQQERQKVAQRLTYFNARNSIFKPSLNRHHYKPDRQASTQDHAARFKAWQKSFELWSKLPAPISTFPLLAIFYVYTRTHMYLLLLTSFGRGPLEVLLQQPPLWTIFIYTLGRSPWDTKHRKTESTKGQVADEHISLKTWAFLASGALFSTGWFNQCC